MYTWYQVYMLHPFRRHVFVMLWLGPLRNRLSRFAYRLFSEEVSDEIVYLQLLILSKLHTSDRSFMQIV